MLEKLLIDPPLRFYVPPNREAPSGAALRRNRLFFKANPLLSSARGHREISVALSIGIFYTIYK
jgi:hypothetical protein